MKFIKKTSEQKHAEQRKRFHAWVEGLPEFKVAPLTLSFWRDSFLFFVMFGMVGHVVDILWRIMMDIPVETWIWQLTPIIAEPYGFGALALLWFVYPLVRTRKIGPFATYVLGAILTTAVEFLCGAVMMLTHGGVNPYWTYSHLPFNLFGIVCLYNAIFFGLVSVVFAYFIFPSIDKQMKRIGGRAISVLAIALAVCYGISLISQLLTGTRLFF
ncbi:hypothetical protein FACS189431_8920 [Alphaproteobacteria bacterium]|nr:hypothetical protein FACS189431_8920 [Alphaproteobacteria bacterium]